MYSRKAWDEYFIKLAHLVSSKSKDRSAKVGAVIVGPNREIRSTGYNGFAKGVNDNVDERHTRPLKYSFTEHGERNAVYQAAMAGTSTNGCIMYLNWEPLPCPDCARAVIQSGIVEVVGPNRPFGGATKKNQIDWQATFKIAKDMFLEAGVRFRTVKVDIDFTALA